MAGRANAGVGAVAGRFAAWWLAVLVLIALVPFALTDLPPMTDLAGHVGRYHVMLEGDLSPWLRLHYRFDWLLIGNLGGDLIAWATGPALGAERAGWLVAVLIPLLTIAGIGAVSRALHGRVQPSAAIAACFVFGNPFHFGFVNYCLALGVALLAFAAWVAMRDRSVAARLSVAAPLVLATWVAHAMGWGVLALLVAGFEGERLWRARSAGAAGPAAAMALAFAPPALLTLLWRQGGSGPLFAYGTDLPARKLMTWVAILRGGEPALDIGVPVALGLLVAWLLWRRALAVDWRIGAGGMLLAVACTVMPTTLFGSWAADERLAPAAAIALALSLRSTGSAGQGRALLIIAAALFTARVGETALRWHREDARRAQALGALASVPRGARIHAVVLVDGCRSGWTANGWTHLPSLAIARRDALVNTQWPLVGAALLAVRYPLPPAIRHDPSQQVPAFGCGSPGLAGLHGRIRALPRDRLDYLWVLDTRGSSGLWAGRRPIHADADSALFALAEPKAVARR